MKVYLAGYINDKKMEECRAWRRKIVDFYRKRSYPIIWLDPLNGKNCTFVENEGLKSNIPPKAILDGDIMSIEESNLIVANMDKFGETRDMTGTTCEIAIAGYRGTPVIMISKDPNYIYHPFLQSFATIIVGDVDELLEKKYINYFYKRINDAIYQ